MSKQEDRIKQALDRFVHEINESNKRISKKKKEQKEKEAKAKKEYNDWREKLRSEAERSANIIFEWVGQLLRSDFWNKFRSDYGAHIGDLPVSENITYNGPRPNPYHPYGTDGFKSLSLDISGTLYVHHHVKYGKSHEIRNIKDILEYVDFPIIIQIATTVSDNSIWSIIERELDRKIKNRIQRDNEFYYPD